MSGSPLLLLAFTLLLAYAHSYKQTDYANVHEQGNYTCDEILRWIGTEKHYSNDKKEILFGLLAGKSCESNPVMLLDDVSFGWSPSGKRSFFSNPRVNGKSAKKCFANDDYVIAFLSNFSINNNFSHFLHAILRLFCALIDGRLIKYNIVEKKFYNSANYSIWLDEYFKMSPEKTVWLNALGGTIRHLSKIPKKGDCVSSKVLQYGSGCVRLLPPEKWFGYPHCRAGEILPAFGEYMRQQFGAQGAKDLRFVDELEPRSKADVGLRTAFAVRDATDTTGKRVVSNLQEVQKFVKGAQHVRASMENVTFEHLDVPSTVRYMAGVHIFVSVHGAGMTNMFFMNPGSAVVEIIPYPLCNCRSPDYFYGTGGYYHGSAVAQGIKHYHYCVPPEDMVWHQKPDDVKAGGKCSWKHLHAVESMHVDPTRFVSLMRNVERDLVIDGTIVLSKPIINVGAHANG